MKDAPSWYTIERLAEHFRSGPQVRTADGKSKPARSLGFYSLKNRLTLALDVFRGRADAVYWGDHPTPKAY